MLSRGNKHPLYRFIADNVPKKRVHSKNKKSTTEGISLLDTILNPKGSREVSIYLNNWLKIWV